MAGPSPVARAETLQVVPASSRLRSEVERELRALLSRAASPAGAYGVELARLWTLAARQVQDGKLLRPLLLLQTYDALREPGRNGTDRAEVVRIAAAVEALHYAFLLHDDVIDGDVIRRGRLNLIGELARGVRDEARPGGAEHWAHAGGILAGDLMLTAAHHAFARADIPAEPRSRLLDLLQHTIFETTAGELCDVGLSDGVLEPDLDAVLSMTRRKTAGYSFELPLRAAVILAGGTADLEHRMSAAGAHLGLAYQLQDDVLSTFGDPAVHGKDPFSDLREGKETAIIGFARMTAAWPRIAPDLGDPALSVAQSVRLRDRLRECGAEEFVLGLIREHLRAFGEAIETTDDELPQEARHVLRDLARRIEGRGA